MSAELAMLQLLKYHGAISSCTSIVNRYSSGGVLSTNSLVSTSAVATLTGTVSANTLKTILNVTNSGGYLNLLFITAADTTSRTMRIKITMDGVVVFDAISAACTAAGKGVVAVGSSHRQLATTVPAYEEAVKPLPTRFNTTCKVEIASSVSEVDLTAVYYDYTLTN
jgi:hypothetical protein